MKKRLLKRTLSMLLCLMMLVSMMAGMASAKNNEFTWMVSDRGSATLFKLVQKLPVVGTMMFVGAHPDDENNGFMTYGNKGLHLNTSYLVMNWGEGGLNQIGPELYGALGVLRSQELASARVLDGGRQLHMETMTDGQYDSYDFGYSISLAETLGVNRSGEPLDGIEGIWPYETMLAELVRHIRTERPDVIFTNHSRLATDHGQHQATGTLVWMAVQKAGDPDYKLEGEAAALLPWTPAIAYTRNNAECSLPGAVVKTVDVGVYDPVLGMSYAQIGALSRAFHKCQGMNSIPNMEPSNTNWTPMWKDDGVVVHANSDVLEGVDVSLSRIYDLIDDAGAKAAVKAKIDALSALIASITANTRASYLPDELQAKIEDDVIEGLALVREAIAAADAIPDEVQRDYALGMLRDKETDFIDLANLLFGVELAVTTSESDRNVTPGQTQSGAKDLTVTPTIYNRGVTDIDSVALEIEVADGWSVEGGAVSSVGALRAETSANKAFSVRPAGTAYTGPYDAAPVTAHAEWSYGGQTIPVSCELEMRLVPKLSLSVSPENTMLIKKDEAITTTVDVVVKNNTVSAASGNVTIALPAGWTADAASKPYSIPAENGEQAVSFDVTLPKGAAAGDYTAKISASLGSEAFSQGFSTIAYDHIDTKLYYTPSVANISLVDMKVAPVKVAYVDTGKDTMYEYLRMMGFDVTVIDNYDLLKAPDLASKYDTIVIGTQGYSDSNPKKADLVAANANLLDNFVAKGGNMIVQYNGRGWDASYAPAPFDLAGSVNINNENADITLNPAVAGSEDFRYLLGGSDDVNTITKADFEGWFQQISEWTPNNASFAADDSDYLRVFWGADPDPKAEDGRLGENRYPWLVKKVGDGYWQYTSVVWHLQLDHLVPGAYRMFANAVSLPYNNEHAKPSTGGGSHVVVPDTGSGTPVVQPPEEPVTPDVSDAVTTTTVKVDPSDNGAYLSTEKADEAIALTVKAAAQAGTKAGLELVAAASPLTLEKGALDALSDQLELLVVTTPDGRVSFDRKAMDHIAASADGDVVIAVEKLDDTRLTAAEKTAAGNMPVFDLTVTGGAAEISGFGDGLVKAELALDAADVLDANKIVAYAIDENGAKTLIPLSRYDAKTGLLKFVAPYPGRFTAGYVDVSYLDIARTAWYAGAVDFVSARGLFSGFENKFDPDETMTRAMFATVLARLDGADLESYSASPFTDVPAGAWYTQAVAWAADKGIVNGVGGGRFDPDGNITREQMAVMLINYIDYAGIKLEKTSVGRFADDASISSWAQDAVRTARAYGLISGVGENIFSPAASADRASVATIFMNFVTKLVG